MTAIIVLLYILISIPFTVALIINEEIDRVDDIIVCIIISPVVLVMAVIPDAVKLCIKTIKPKAKPRVKLPKAEIHVR